MEVRSGVCEVVVEKRKRKTPLWILCVNEILILKWKLWKYLGYMDK
jgi:hypothetical protein